MGGQRFVESPDPYRYGMKDSILKVAMRIDTMRERLPRDGLSRHVFTLWLSVAAATFLSVSAALADDVPDELVGRWSPDCARPTAARFIIEPANIIFVSGTQPRSYPRILVSHTYYGGAKASSGNVWLLVGEGPGEKSGFVIMAGPKRPNFIVLEDVSPEADREIKALLGAKFRRCEVKGASGTSADAMASGLAAREAARGSGGKLDIPIVQPAGDGQMADCATSVVAGLKRGGDGFLAVRSGPAVSIESWTSSITERQLSSLKSGESGRVSFTGPKT